MRKIATSALLFSTLLALGVAPGFGVSKQTIQMMTQLDSLQQEVQTLQRTVDTQTAIIKTLLQQNSSGVASMKADVGKMQNAEQQNLAATSNRLDSMTSQIEQLSASLQETQAQLSKLSDQLAQTQKIMQTLNAPQPQAAGAAGTPGAAGAAGTPGATGSGAAAPGAGNSASSGASGPAAQAANPAATIPDPQTLYQSAYADYTQGQYPLAIQGFQEYLQDYGNTDLASNAQFYIGDSYYAQKDYKTAITQYNKCITQYPHGNKEAAARLKKAYALLNLGQRSAGERELALLIRANPNTREANLAQERLRHLRARGR